MITLRVEAQRKRNKKNNFASKPSPSLGATSAITNANANVDASATTASEQKGSDRDGDEDQDALPSQLVTREDFLHFVDVVKALRTTWDLFPSRYDTIQYNTVDTGTNEGMRMKWIFVGQWPFLGHC